MPNQRYQEVLRGNMRYQDVERGIKGYQEVSRCIKMYQEVSKCIKCIKGCQDYQGPQSIIDCINGMVFIISSYLLETCLRY